MTRSGPTAELCGSSSSAVFQNYKFNFATENRKQLLSVFVSGSVVMTVILNTTFVLWLTAQSVHCTLLQPGCTIIFNGLDLHSVLGSKRHSWRLAAAALQVQGVKRGDKIIFVFGSFCRNDISQR